MRVLNVLMSSLQGGCMSIAITKMVKSTASSISNSTSNTSASSDVCTVPVDTSSTTVSADTEGDFDWSELTQSYVTNGPTYGALCTMLIGAYIAQRWSPKMTLTYITTLSIVCSVLTPVLAHWSVHALIISRVLQGLSAGMGMPASGQLESSWFPPKERQQLSGAIVSASHAGSILSSSLTGFLIETYSWKFVFYLYGGICVVPLVLWMIFVHDTPQKHPWISDEEKEYISARVKKNTEEKFPVPWLQIAMSPPVWAFLSMSVSITWLSFIYMTELPTYLKRMLHFSTSKAGYITSLANAATVSSQLLSGFFSHWMRRKGYISHLTSYRIFNAIATLGPAGTILAITQVGCDATTIVAMLLITMFLHGTFISGSMLNHMDLAINFVPFLVAINGTIISIVGIISPTFTAFIINNNQTLSAWSKVFYIAAAVSAVPYVVFFIFGSSEEQTWNKPQYDVSKEASKTIEASGPQQEKERRESKDSIVKRKISRECKVNIS